MFVLMRNVYILFCSLVALYFTMLLMHHGVHEVIDLLLENGADADATDKVSIVRIHRVIMCFMS